MTSGIDIGVAAASAAVFGLGYGALRGAAPRRSRLWFGCTAAPVVLAIAVRHAFALTGWLMVPLVALALVCQRLAAARARATGAPVSAARWRTAVYAGIAGAVLLLAGPDAHAHGHGTHAGAAAYERIEVDEPAPAFALTNQRGAPVALADLRGRVVLMTFMYSTCTDVCPVLVSVADAVAARLPAESREQLVLVGITVDPLRDTPTRLAGFMRERGFADARWQFLTGSVAALTQVASDYGIVVRPAPRGDFVHNSVFIVIDAEGVERAEFHGTATPVAELLATVTSLIAR